MKRLLLVVALVLLPSAVFAQSAGVDRDVLLTADGTLYTIESEYAENFPQMNVRAGQFLLLTAQNGANVTKTVVPDSTTEGLHRRPALAYDSESDTLFVFWLRTPNAMSSELLVASYQGGKWRAATSIDDKPMTFRYNLRIAVTRRVAQTQRDGSLLDVPMVVVHAVWWEITGNGETAHYAMLPVDHGRIILTEPAEQLHELNDFVTPASAQNEVPPTFNSELLRHPAIIDSSSFDSIDVVFGDTKSNSFNRTTLRPIMAEGRLRIPVGVTKGGKQTRFAVPSNFTSDWNGRIETIANGHSASDRVLMYSVGEKSVSYLVYADGKWSSLNALPLNERFSADAAVTALSRMINASE